MSVRNHLSSTLTTRNSQVPRKIYRIRETFQQGRGLMLFFSAKEPCQNAAFPGGLAVTEICREVLLRRTLRRLGRATTRAAAVDNIITTALQCFFGLTADVPVTVGQSASESANHGSPAAATIVENLIADFVGRFGSHTFVAVVQSIDEGVHDFGVTDAVVSITQFMDRVATVSGIAFRHRSFDESGNLTTVFPTAAILTTTAGRPATSGHATGRLTTGIFRRFAAAGFPRATRQRCTARIVRTAGVFCRSTA